ncbi:MAG TPA: hypothetical protein VIX84_13550 [Acidimicrobiales bacterium]
MRSLALDVEASTSRGALGALGALGAPGGLGVIAYRVQEGV